MGSERDEDDERATRDERDERATRATSNGPTLGGFDRRTLLSAGLVVGALQACTKPEAPQTAMPKRVDGDGKAAEGDRATDAFVPVLVAIADRLLPDDATGPGARAAGVEGFFRKAFRDPRLSTVHPLLKRGCAFLMRAAQAEGRMPFVALTDDAKDDLIRRLVEGHMRPDGFAGPTFIRMVMALTLEGYLGDPRHGGNVDGVGWRAVGFSPEGRAQGLALKVLP